MNNEKLEVELAKTTDAHGLENFLKLTFFCAPAQIALIRRGNFELFKIYVSKYNLDDEAQCVLAAEATREFLVLAAERKVLKCFKAIKILAERV